MNMKNNSNNNVMKNEIMIIMIMKVMKRNDMAIMMA